MNTMLFNFENLTVYKRSLEFSKNIYTVTQQWSKEHLFGLTNQLRRASFSIPLNIAEGSSRTKKDFSHFLIISRGSCFECIPILSIAYSLKLLTESSYKKLYNEAQELARMLSSLRSSLLSH
jgi:four helix bundle protein